MATLEEERKRLGYKPVTQIKVPEIPALSDDVIKTGEKYSMGTTQQSSSSSSMQGTQSEGTSHNETAVRFDPNAINELKDNISVYDDLFSKSATINPEEDSVIKKLGQMRKRRESLLKENLQSSADRERKKLKYNAWTNFLTSLGNIAGMGKAAEIPDAVRKAIDDAKKNMINVPMVNTTIAHEVIGEFGAGRVLLKPAGEGTGVLAGGCARAVLELAGIRDIRAKSLRSNNPRNLVSATIEGLKALKVAEDVARLRGKTVEEILG